MAPRAVAVAVPAALEVAVTLLGPAPLVAPQDSLATLAAQLKQCPAMGAPLRRVGREWGQRGSVEFPFSFDALYPFLSPPPHPP